MNLTVLKTEINTGPLSRSHARMSDVAIADSLNVIDRSVNRTSVSPGELQAAVVGSEFVTLSAGFQRMWLAVLSDSVDPNNSNIVAQIAEIWGPGTTTRQNLIALKTEAGSRAEELNLGSVTPSDVANAKRL